MPDARPAAAGFFLAVWSLGAMVCLVGAPAWFGLSGRGLGYTGGWASNDKVRARLVAGLFFVGLVGGGVAAWVWRVGMSRGEVEVDEEGGLVVGGRTKGRMWLVVGLVLALAVEVVVIGWGW